MSKSSCHLIIRNAKIYDHSEYDTALAIQNDRIVAIGSDHDIIHLSNANTQMVNAQERWILPAFMDSHTHLSGYAARKLQVELSDRVSMEEALQRIKLKVDSTPQNSWITGGGWDKNKWGLADFPDRNDLDRISTSHFIALDSKDCHSLWVNSPALSVCGIDGNTTEPKDGRIRRRADGEPTGVLQEKARNLILKKIPQMSAEQLKPALLEAFQEFYQFGITAVHSMETGYDFSIYQRLKAEGKQGLRIFYYLPIDKLSSAEDLQIHAGFGDSFLKICGIKLFADGALGSQSAAMLENYDGLNHRGIEVLSREELKTLVERCISHRLNCAIHAIGDGANRNVLKIFSDLYAESQQLGLRHRIEHAQLLNAADIPLFKENSIIASVQPIHLAHDIPMIRKYWDLRGRYAYAFGSLANSGARLIFGSDTPIESFDPWSAIYTALQRKYLVNPAQDSFYPDEKIDVDQAIMAYTANSAFAVGEESILGSIEIGKQADLIIIDKDIFIEPAEVLLDTKVALTVQAGQIMHQNM